MNANVRTQMLVALALMIATVLAAHPTSVGASAIQSTLNNEVTSDSTVVHLKHWQRMDETGSVTALSDEEILAARWDATADFYADNGLLNEAVNPDLTVVLVKHWQRLNGTDATVLSDEEILAARWNATADFYADNGLLNEAVSPDSTVVLVNHWQRLNGTDANALSDEVVQVASLTAGR